MIRGRATGPGPRTVALPGDRATGSARARRGRVADAIVAIVASLALLVACGTATPATPSASAVTGGSSGPPTAAASTPPSAESSATAGPDAGGPSASIRRWPTNAVTAMIALGAADAELAKAGADLQAAVDREDLAAMRAAADGLAQLVDKLLPNIDDLDAEPTTQAIAKIYHVAFPEISAGAKQLRDAITAGDANGILAGTERLLRGLNDYAPARAQLPDLVAQALAQQRLYVE